MLRLPSTLAPMPVPTRASAHTLWPTVTHAGITGMGPHAPISRVQGPDTDSVYPRLRQAHGRHPEGNLRFPCFRVTKPIKTVLPA